MSTNGMVESFEGIHIDEMLNAIVELDHKDLELINNLVQFLYNRKKEGA